MASIFVSTYAKYNAGSLFGARLDPEDYACLQDFMEACAELHADEADPEYMNQDFEGVPAAFISESHIDPELWNYLACSADEGAKEAYMECFGDWDEYQFYDSYRGQFDSWAKMAEELLESTGELGAIPENLRYYFDYDAYARDMRLGGDMCEHEGYFFWNH